MAAAAEEEEDGERNLGGTMEVWTGREVVWIGTSLCVWGSV
jgi:hypothetical protein